jgi:hypothetical protein
MRLALPSLVVLGAALVGCSDDPGPEGQPEPKTTVTQTVGPDGGTIELDGATVTFPAGALAADTEVTIAATDESPPSGHTALSRIYACEPSGLDFDPKVVMAMAFEDDGTAPTMFWSSGSDPAFADVGGSASGGVMTASVAHFSRGFVGHAP